MLALLLWQIVAACLAMPVFLPTPLSVLKTLWQLLCTGETYAVFFTSLGHLLLGFSLGFVLGTVLAILAAVFPLLEVLLYPYMLTVRAIPVASFVVLAILWFSSRLLSQIISFFVVLPLVYHAVLEALRTRDRRMDEMADVFAIPFPTRLRHIWFPQIRAALLSSAGTGMGLAWKSGVAAELIGMHDGTIGDRLYLSKLYLDTPGLFAWTLLIVLGSLICERGLLFLLRHLLGERRGRHA